MILADTDGGFLDDSSGHQRIAVSTSWPDYQQSGLARVIRVDWALEEDKVVRSLWPVMDRAQDSEPIRQSILRGVSKLAVRFLDPDTSFAVAAESENARREGLLEIEVEFEDGLDLKRIIAVSIPEAQDG